MNDIRVGELPPALHGPPPRRFFDGDAKYLAKAKLPFRIGMAAALAFCLPLFYFVASDESDPWRVFGGA